MEDFGIKYTGHKHTKHPTSNLSEHYRFSHDWDGQRYLGMNLNWDYTGRVVHESMLDYVPEALARFQHKPPQTPQHQPYPHIKPTCGATAQYTKDVDTTPLLDKEGKKHIQEVIGTFLYYVSCVNSTMLMALGSLATQQANPTTNTKKWSINFWTMRRHIPTQSSHIRQATWSSQDTAMLITCRRPMHAVKQEDISSC
jgi:hypothetical protein